MPLKNPDFSQGNCIFSHGKWEIQNPNFPGNSQLGISHAEPLPESVPKELRDCLLSGFDEDQKQRSDWSDVILALRKYF